MTSFGDFCTFGRPTSISARLRLMDARGHAKGRLHEHPNEAGSACQTCEACVHVGLPLIKRLRRATQLLSKMLNARRDECDAGEEKGNKGGGGRRRGEKNVTSGFFSSAIVRVCVEQWCDSSRSVPLLCLRMSLTIRPLPFAFPPSVFAFHAPHVQITSHGYLCAPLAPRISSAVSLRLPRLL